MKAEIIGNLSGHEFKHGEIVNVELRPNHDGHYIGRSDNDWWFLEAEDFKYID